MTKVVLLHPTGNANVRATAYGLHNAHLLEQFFTAIASFPGDWLDKLSGLPGLGEVKRRQYSPEIKSLTRYSPWYELSRLLALKLKMKSLVQHETGVFSVDSVYQHHDQWVASKLKSFTGKAENTAVYAYEDGARFSFQKAKQLNIPCYYDLPIGYWRAARRLLQAEIEKWPDWTSTLTGFKDSATKLGYKDEELHLADHIFVASSFTAKTLQDFPGKLAPITVVPYGFPPVCEKREYASQHGPLRLLFVGGLSQRKGIANLFEAVKAFGTHVELTVVGRKASNNCAALDEALAQHRWIPSLPHAEILKLMQTQDVFVFPSLFEGFGLVITEAMSQGTPVITTDRTAGPDVITHAEDGWLVEAGSTEALQQAIEQLLLNRNLIADAGRAAMERARQRPWSVYGQELAARIEAISKGTITGNL
ncbi:glycosyltransferase family 4 protein [Mucilaginibacter robiniae]|uniref:Glycosyltransferase family 4 protein n=1 Tax=Mucilaginibacter robiniae TaxID=2728022 RepID=A0A7L5E0Q5_9SPHI|nr:glycosyltransferase family 4 protein [Mucilaginibacter robiniae]QJD96952.1 glycosyltransferase family 4 protein [Mucilaginibacter robiniae]